MTPIKTSPQLSRAHKRVRTNVLTLDIDRPPASEIEAITRLIASGALKVPREGEVK